MRYRGWLRRFGLGRLCPFSGVDVQTVVQHLNVKELFERGFDLLDARVTKFKDLAGVGEDDMVVLLDPVALLVLGPLVAKLMASHQIAIKQQVEGVVQRGS